MGSTVAMEDMQRFAAITVVRDLPSRGGPVKYRPALTNRLCLVEASENIHTACLRPTQLCRKINYSYWVPRDESRTFLKWRAYSTQTFAIAYSTETSQL